MIRYYKFIYCYETDVSPDYATLWREGFSYGKSTEEGLKNFRAFLVTKHLNPSIKIRLAQSALDSEFYNYLKQADSLLG